MQRHENLRYVIIHDTDARTKQIWSVRAKLIFEHGILDLGRYIVHSDILILLSFCILQHCVMCCWESHLYCLRVAVIVRCSKLICDDGITGMKTLEKV